MCCTATLAPLADRLGLDLGVLVERHASSGKAGEVIEAIVRNYNKGGLLVDLDGVRGIG